MAAPASAIDLHPIVRVLVRRAAGAGRWEAQVVRRLQALPGVEVIEASAGAPGAGDGHPLVSHDVVLDLGVTAGDSSPVTPLDCDAPHPALGVWRFVYGDEGRLSDPATKEWSAGNRGALIQLVSITGHGSATLLEGGAIKTVAHSLHATRERLFASAVDWPARALRRVLASPDRKVRGRSVQCSAGTRGPATSGAFPTIRGYTRRLAQEAIEEHWSIGLIAKPVHHVLHAFDAAEIQWLEPPRHHAIADPLGVVERHGKLTLLAEAFDFTDRQGRIVALEVDSGRIVSAPREVLRLPVHLSYPHVIFHGGEIFCLPEAAASGRVQLYRASSFPDRWVPDRILLQGFAGADATIHPWQGRWWMFVCDHADQDETRLHVFHAPELPGPWEPHALNPVKCDLRSARPAGPLFEHEGALYRPAQDGSKTYGGAIAVNRVTALTPTDFSEETVTVLNPSAASPYPHGLHTLAGTGRYTVVDGKRHRHSLRRLAWGLSRLAREKG